MTRTTRTIALLSAVPCEGEMLVKELRLRKKPEAGLVLYAGADIVYCISGVGKTNAAHAATRLVHEFSPAIVINFGIGGAYPGSGLDVNHIAVATTEVYADEGVWLTDGYHGLDVIGIPLARAGQRRYFNEFPMDGRLARSALRASVLVAPSRSGAFATVSLCTGTKRRALDMVKRFNVVCENMEGASIAHVCRLYNTPCVEIRGISNRVDDRNRADWDIGTSSANCQRAVIEFLQSLRRLP